jgi:hypothetical protein
LRENFKRESRLEKRGRETEKKLQEKKQMIEESKRYTKGFSENVREKADGRREEEIYIEI